MLKDRLSNLRERANKVKHLEEERIKKANGVKALMTANESIKIKLDILGKRDLENYNLCWDNSNGDIFEFGYMPFEDDRELLEGYETFVLMELLEVETLMLDRMKELI